jgi:hypothetical protein
MTELKCQPNGFTLYLEKEEHVYEGELRIFIRRSSRPMTPEECEKRSLYVLQTIRMEGTKIKCDHFKNAAMYNFFSVIEWGMQIHLIKEKWFGNLIRVAAENYADIDKLKSLLHI